MTNDSVLTTVRAAVRVLAPGGVVADDTPLIAAGIIDSLSLLSLIARLEEEFRITVRDVEVLPANFGSIDAIRSFLTTKGL
jgi:acyl carrier protein